MDGRILLNENGLNFYCSGRNDWGDDLLGFMLTKEEKKEMEYILKRELEELLFDFEDERIHDVVKRRWKKDIKSFLFVSKSR